MVKIYGIKNCNTMKKAFDWLDDANIAYEFHDYKKLGADLDVVKQAIAQHGWEKVINRAGMTWRKLDDDVKAAMDEAGAVKIAEENPSILKRPLMVHEGEIYLGFKDKAYESVFA